MYTANRYESNLLIAMLTVAFFQPEAAAEAVAAAIHYF